jgi:hypothetical protein
MDPDTYLFYEYMDKLPFTVRMKIRLDAPVDATLLDEAAQGAIHPLSPLRCTLRPRRNPELHPQAQRHAPAGPA